MAVLTIDSDGWNVKRIEIPQKKTMTKPEDVDIRKVIETTVREIQRGRSVDAIARKYGVDPSQAAAAS